MPVYGFLLELILGSVYFNMVKIDGYIHDSPQQNLNSLCYSGLCERLGGVDCPIVELFCSVDYGQGWVNDLVMSLF